MVFELDGLNLLPYIKNEGLKWAKNDIDDDAERVVGNAKMYRNKLAAKKKAEVQLTIVTAEVLATICAKIDTEYTSIKFTDFVTNTEVTREFYCSSINNAVAIPGINGESDKYKNCSFNIVER